MTAQMFTWRVGAIPLDVYMHEKGRYHWTIPGMKAVHRAVMAEKGNWSLILEDGTPVQLGLSSLRACIARSFEVGIESVRNVM